MIITSALISFTTWLSGRLADRGFDYLFDSSSKRENLNKRFYLAVDNASKRLQQIYPDALGNSIAYFFKHEELFGEIAQQLFFNSTIDAPLVERHLDNNTLPPNFIQDFIRLLRTEVLLDEKLAPILNNQQIFILLRGLNRSLENLSQNSNLSLEELRKVVELLEERSSNQFQFTDFYSKYKESALRVLSQVNFIGLGVDSSIKRKRKILQDIFVKPSFVSYQNKENEESGFEFREDEKRFKEITYKDIFYEGRKRIVVLGNPGSGKSVLIRSLICDILNKRQSEFGDDELINCIPFRIELRKYLQYKRNKGGNILKYLSAALEEEYGINNVTESVMNRLMTAHDSIIFFDGLDEIFKAKDKIDVKNDIENFHTMHTKVRSLTSSRIIGYDEASLDEANFAVYRILNFSHEQVEEYVKKWYKKEEDDEETRMKEIKKFLNLKNEIDQELITNPLLLSLIVILYRNTLKIPESKLDIYQSCTRTLVDKWDAEKDLQIDLDTRLHKEKDKVLSDLAYWQYEQLSSESIQISYEKSKSRVIWTLKNKINIADDQEAEDLAESFMSYAQKRSIYFDNNFTHKTFLEYYTAYWIYSNIEKKHKENERNEIISKYITNPFWFIVLELLLNMIDKDQPDSEIVDDIVTSQVNKEPLSTSFLLSSIPTLKNISPSAASRIIYVSISTLIKNSPDSRKISTSHRLAEGSDLFFQLQRLHYRNDTYRKLIDDEFLKFEDQVRDPLVYNLYFEINFAAAAKESLGWQQIESLRKQVNLDPFLFRLQLEQSEDVSENYFVHLLKYIELFGVPKLFTSDFGQFAGFGYSPFIDRYLQFQVDAKNIHELESNFLELSKREVTFALISEYLIKEEYFYFSRFPLTKIIEYLDTTKNNQVAFILAVMIIRSIENQKREIEPALNFIDLSEKYKNRKDFFRSLISISTSGDQIKHSMKYFLG